MPQKKTVLIKNQCAELKGHLNWSCRLPTFTEPLSVSFFSQLYQISMMANISGFSLSWICIAEYVMAFTSVP